MDNIYPPGPSGVPSDLTKASASYKRRAWLALGSLTLFICLYFALTGWFVWTAYRIGLSFSQGADFKLAALLTGGAAAFLSIFMAKALFFVKSSGVSQDIQITKEEHPELFKFLYKLADEAGAPRPHKVFLSSDVNAAVFYDLSLLNLIFPSKKNLIIGLGLINVLNLAELKAVLAHEFGHFAQKSMAVGRWVYIAQQIAAQIIGRRDMLDKFLQGLSRFDLRIAWVGWILSLIIWSIRSLLDSVFSLVIIAQRALSRQMEFQADLVAVSLTGSDSLVNALHKLGAADDAWNRAMNFASSEAQEERVVKDIFAVQTRVIEKLRTIYDDQEYGTVPSVPEENPESHRVFKSQMASPPQMWATHPENTAREENAKKVYLRSTDDERSAWVVFNNPEKIKHDMSARLLAGVKGEVTDVEDSFKHLDKKYSKTYLMPCFRGVYLGRVAVRHAEKPADLFDEEYKGPASPEELNALYPHELSDHFETLRSLSEEKHHLEGLKEKVYKASGGIIYFRGKSIKRKDLPEAIAKVSEEIKDIEDKIHGHDKQCRTLHLAAAKKLGNGWPEYLQGLSALIHYADHTEADLYDALGFIRNTIAVIMADGNVSGSEMTRLLNATKDAHNVLSRVFKYAEHVTYDSNIAKRMDNPESWAKYLGDYQLPPATNENINDWINAYENWTFHAAASMSNLKLAALEVLLIAETKVAKAIRTNTTMGTAPKASTTPENYRVLTPGKERELQRKLDFWDSFQTATGFFPATARILVAGSIIGGMVFFGQSVGNSAISIFNGLQTVVSVSINGEVSTVRPNSSAEIEVPVGKNYLIVTKTKDGKMIESFEKTDNGYGSEHFIYNVAGASPLYRWTAVYGSGSQPKDVDLGSPRWLASHADYYFEEPPESLQTSKNGTTRSIISAYSQVTPDVQLNTIKKEEQQKALVEAHARWDSANSKYMMHWLSFAHKLEGYEEIVNARLAEKPEETLFMREAQILAGDTSDSEVCQHHSALANAEPQNPNYIYLNIRCMDDSPEQDLAFIQASNKWPENEWLAMAASYPYQVDGEWEKALEKYDLMARKNPALKTAFELDHHRLQRVIKGKAVSNNKRQISTRSLQYYLAMELGKGTENSPYKAYSTLEKGDFENAIKQSAGDPEVQARVLRLAAASNGAPQDIVKQALDMPSDKGIDESSVWSAYALAARHQKDTTQYRNYIEQLSIPGSKKVLAFFEALKAGESVSDSALILDRLPLEQRAFAYTMAAIYLGENCPSTWVEQADTLLFASERPVLI